MRSPNETGNPVSRRIALKHHIVDTAAIVAVPVVFTIASAIDRTTRNHAEAAPNLGLSIDSKEFNRVIAGGSKQEAIATNITSVTCPTWAPGICMGSNSPDLKAAVNKPMAEFMIKQAGMINSPIPTSILFVNDFGEKDQAHQGEQGGFTFLTDGNTKQTIVILLKFAAWYTFNYLDDNKLNQEDYFNGTLSLFVSEELIHEMAHAGKELKMQAKSGFTVSPELLDRVHPQVYQFQEVYKNLYKALSDDKKRHALLVGFESKIPVIEYRRRIMQEATQRGFKWNA